MSVFQPDTESGSGQLTARDLPAFQVVRRGYDPTQVDAYIPQLVARLEEAERARAELQREVASLQRQAPPSFEQLGAEAAVVLQEAGRSGEQLVEKARRRADTIVDGAQQQAEQIRTEVTGKAQAVLAEANQAAEQVHQEVEQQRAALYAETQQVREFRDGLLENLGRVQGDISALLERTRRHKAQAPPAADHAARPEIDAAPELVVEEASEPAGAAKSTQPQPTQPQPTQAPTDARGQQRAALAQAAAARRPGYLSAPARQESRRPGPAG
jgi:cell division septum initiation protein DivIVA